MEIFRLGQLESSGLELIKIEKTHAHRLIHVGPRLTQGVIIIFVRMKRSALNQGHAVRVHNEA